MPVVNDLQGAAQGNWRGTLRSQPRKARLSLFLSIALPFEQLVKSLPLALPGRPVRAPPSPRRIKMVPTVRAVIPPARVPQALKQRRRMAVDEVHVAADRLVEKREDATARMRGGHRGEDV